MRGSASGRRRLKRRSGRGRQRGAELMNPFPSRGVRFCILSASRAVKGSGSREPTAGLRGGMGGKPTTVTEEDWGLLGQAGQSTQGRVGSRGRQAKPPSSASRRAKIGTVSCRHRAIPQSAPNNDTVHHSPRRVFERVLQRCRAQQGVFAVLSLSTTTDTHSRRLHNTNTTTYPAVHPVRLMPFRSDCMIFRLWHCPVC